MIDAAIENRKWVDFSRVMAYKGVRCSFSWFMTAVASLIGFCRADMFV